MSAILETRGLSRHFRGVIASEDINFVLAAGEVRAVIGPNGAGKTTFLSMISGHLRPSAGRVLYKGVDITKRSIVHRARLGIVRKFQTPTVFDNLSAHRNIELAVLRTDCPRRERDERIGTVLQRVRLQDQADTPAQFLSHGQRQWLEIGLLVAIRGELLLLDEPTAGMTAEETAATGDLVTMLARDMELSVIIIEHDINFIRDLRAPVTVLHLGRILKEGSFEEVAEDERVREVYLGTGS
ncbi:MAG: urea transport system ATP-binding protein [Alphaproteobacteria bacterium]|nr:urea transport system ATP-binding protein [Alphaproteobacteria bacterium]